MGPAPLFLGSSSPSLALAEQSRASPPPAHVPPPAAPCPSPPSATTAAPRPCRSAAPRGRAPPRVAPLPVAGRPHRVAVVAPRPTPLYPRPGPLTGSCARAAPSPHLGLALSCRPPPAASPAAAVPPAPVEPDLPRGAPGIPRSPRATVVVGRATAGPATYSGQSCHCRPGSLA
ncbi:uncharacterized protein [Miscanthus floridulus]|uniref:uncharacterized protein n=1 Tax=Miscanthus floridulus TaxID=154761 RepID=UPI0034583146